MWFLSTFIYLKGLYFTSSLKFTFAMYRILRWQVFFITFHAFKAVTSLSFHLHCFTKDICWHSYLCSSACNMSVLPFWLLCYFITIWRKLDYDVPSCFHLHVSYLRLSELLLSYILLISQPRVKSWYHSRWKKMVERQKTIEFPKKDIHYRWYSYGY